MFMFIRFCILLSVLALGASQHVANQSVAKCNITEDIQGECILYRLCPRALDLLKERDVATLMKINCGFDKLDAKVCCVTERTDEALVFKDTTKQMTNNQILHQFGNMAGSSVPLLPDPTTRPIYASTEPPTTRYTVSTSDSNQEPMKSSPKDDFSTVDKKTLSAPFANSQVEITPSIQPAPSQDRFQNIDLKNILPNRNECGLDGLTDKIYGGQIAKLDEMPWLARIKYQRNSRQVYACHGSLISSRYVLTAAHCAEGLDIIEVRLGEWDTETTVDCMGDECADPLVDVKVERVSIFPFYNVSLLIGDIALLRLATPVNFTDFIRPVCLPTTDYVIRKDYDLEDTFITGGWGRTEYEIRAVVKRRVHLKPVPMSTCRLAIPRISNSLEVSAICAGGRKDEDSCAGDSGSSLVKLVSENNHFNWFLYGVTSFGSSSCGTEGRPGVYTRVTYYMEWILRNIES